MELSDNFHALVTSPTYPCIHLVGGWWALELPWTLYRRKNSFFPCRESNLRFFGCQACSLFRRKNNVVSICLCPFVDNIRSLVYERTSNDVAGYEFFLIWVKEKYLSSKRDCNWYLFITHDPAISIKLGDEAAPRFVHIYIFRSLVMKISLVWLKNYQIQRP